jgi:WD40 repeat protein
LLAAGIGVSQVSSKQTRGCVECFSEPQSTLLFSPAGGDANYGDYTLVTSSGNFAIPQLAPGSMGVISPNWALSPSGDRVAGGITFILNADIVKCDPKVKGWCAPHPRPIVKTVMGVYSVRDKTWKQYGDFKIVGSTAFSPDGKRIAFDVEKECTLAGCRSGLMIVNLETDQMETVPGSVQIRWRDQISWSPDGKFLAVSFNSPGYGQIVVIDVTTGETKSIAEGTNPSWSPKGDWIAYALAVQCMIIHPDGTGARSVLDKERKWMKDTLDSPILWSPDGERLLLNQRKIFDGHPRVIMVDLATGHAVMKSKNGEVVTGWVPFPSK